MAEAQYQLYVLPVGKAASTEEVVEQINICYLAIKHNLAIKHKRLIYGSMHIAKRMYVYPKPSLYRTEKLDVNITDPIGLLLR